MFVRVDRRHDRLRSWTSHRSEIFRLSAGPIGRSERHTIASGWIPMLRSSRTECWVGFVFSSSAGAHVGDQRDVDVAGVVAAQLGLQLADRLEERQRLDVTDGPADLGDQNVGPRVLGRGAGSAP